VHRSSLHLGANDGTAVALVGMVRGVRRGNRGASLFEVLTASAIMATVLGIGVPRVAMLRAPYALSGAAHQIVADIELARQRAIARNKRFRVNFSSVAGSYVLEREEAPNSFVADGATQKLPHGATLGTVSPGNPIFDTRGMLAANTTVPVTVTGAGTKTVTINVLGRTTIN
jgi:Type II transport protein GspH